MKIAGCVLALVLVAGFHTAYAQDTSMKGMDMGKTSTGDADVDFVQGMIPHHEGAVDMAKIELEKGKDPEMRKLAEDIIKAQDAELVTLNAWLSKHKQK